MGFYDVYHGANEMIKELCTELVRMSDEHMAEVREAKANGGIDSMADEELLEHGLVRLPVDADGLVRLPVDADGEPIHVGDMMERGKARGNVIALMLSEYPKKWGGELHWGVQLEGEQAPTALDGFFHHYHEPTDSWERIIEDAMNVHGNGSNPCWTDERDALVARCKKLADGGKEQ